MKKTRLFSSVKLNKNYTSYKYNNAGLLQSRSKSYKGGRVVARPYKGETIIKSIAKDKYATVNTRVKASQWDNLFKGFTQKHANILQQYNAEQLKRNLGVSIVRNKRTGKLNFFDTTTQSAVSKKEVKALLKSRLNSGYIRDWNIKNEYTQLKSDVNSKLIAKDLRHIEDTVETLRSILDDLSKGLTMDEIVNERVDSFKKRVFGNNFKDWVGNLEVQDEVVEQLQKAITNVSPNLKLNKSVKSLKFLGESLHTINLLISEANRANVFGDKFGRSSGTKTSVPINVTNNILDALNNFTVVPYTKGEKMNYKRGVLSYFYNLRK